jgi:Enoyl-CoA hydratase/isomerase
MEFGLFHEFQDTSEAEAFSQSFALVNAAEQWGLDANFAPDRWVLASPLILAAAIAQRTRRMKTLEIVKRAWTEERFSYRGKYFAHDKVALVPKPRQKPSISADPHRCHEHRYLCRDRQAGSCHLRRLHSASGRNFTRREIRRPRPPRDDCIDSTHGRGGRTGWRPWPPRAGSFGRRSVSGPEASSPLQGRREGRIEIVTLNRPAQRNAMSAALVDELIAVIRAIENDPDVGAVVLVGAGAGFCAGSGLGGLAAMDTAARRGFEAASGRVARMIAQSRQSRHFGSVLTTSGLPPTPDMAPHCAN